MRKNDRVLALVLAFGRGRRLMPLTAHRARAAVPFAGTYRLIDFALSNLVNGGVTQVAVLTQYKSNSLNRHIAQAWQLSGMLGDSVAVVPAQMRYGPHWFAGSADAVHQNLDLIGRVRPDHVCVMESDHVYRIDPRQLLAAHRAAGANATLTAVPLEPGCRRGLIELDGRGRVTRFATRHDDTGSFPVRPRDARTFAGIAVFSASALVEAVTRDAMNPWSVHDLRDSVLPLMAARGEVALHELDHNRMPGAGPRDRAYWRDVSDLEGYHRASMELVGPRPGFDLHNRDWPIHSWQPQPAPPAMLTSDGGGGQVAHSLVSPGVIVAGGAVHRSVLSPDVVVEDGAVVEDSVLMNRVRVGRGAVVRCAVIDKEVRIPAGYRIGVDAEADRERFHVTPAGVVAIGKRHALEREAPVPAAWAAAR